MDRGAADISNRRINGIAKPYASGERESRRRKEKAFFFPGPGVNTLGTVAAYAESYVLIVKEIS